MAEDHTHRKSEVHQNFLYYYFLGNICLLDLEGKVRNA